MRSYILIGVIDLLTTKDQILKRIAALGAHFCCYLNKSCDVVLTWLLRIFLTFYLYFIVKCLRISAGVTASWKSVFVFKAAEVIWMDNRYCALSKIQ